APLNRGTQSARASARALPSRSAATRPGAVESRAGARSTALPRTGVGSRGQDGLEQRAAPRSRAALEAPRSRAATQAPRYRGEGSFDRPAARTRSATGDAQQRMPYRGDSRTQDLRSRAAVESAYRARDLERRAPSPGFRSDVQQRSYAPALQPPSAPAPRMGVAPRGGYDVG